MVMTSGEPGCHTLCSCGTASARARRRAPGTGIPQSRSIQASEKTISSPAHVVVKNGPKASSLSESQHPGVVHL
eukprot:CAMPEP_0181202844 /NCGR_PEP_ID=MMETSP1096-20121128/19064_1 /TAXON_ID=156174 ORGANISM="Chrysochromulina ericina, Strain CCMP281" /NCGR_SAMPLE_ID=MMETSP1096 /ASSEMBLY_ACC=CAM_ASM_000453 /LENGTH=73 /DNA_ID=CAMNT_0023293395 /DNA_START=57 /DNA_END=278 /DNA_ORIENTATION=+